MECEPEQSLLVPLAVHDLSYVEEQLCLFHIPVVREDKYPARLLDDEQPVCAVGRGLEGERADECQARKR